MRGGSKRDTCGASWVYGLARSWADDVRAAVGIRPPANGQAWTRRVPHGLRYMAMLGLALDLALGSPPLECADAPCFLTPAACGLRDGGGAKQGPELRAGECRGPRAWKKLTELPLALPAVPAPLCQRPLPAARCPPPSLGPAAGTHRAQGGCQCRAVTSLRAWPLLALLRLSYASPSSPRAPIAHPRQSALQRRETCFGPDCRQTLAPTHTRALAPCRHPVSL